MEYSSHRGRRLHCFLGRRVSLPAQQCSAGRLLSAMSMTHLDQYHIRGQSEGAADDQYCINALDNALENEEYHLKLTFCSM